MLARLLGSALALVAASIVGAAMFFACLHMGLPFLLSLVAAVAANVVTGYAVETGIHFLVWELWTSPADKQLAASKAKRISIEL